MKTLINEGCTITEHADGGGYAVTRPDNGYRIVVGKLEVAPDGFEIVSYHTTGNMWTPNLDRINLTTTKLRKLEK